MNAAPVEQEKEQRQQRDDGQRDEPGLVDHEIDVFVPAVEDDIGDGLLRDGIDDGQKRDAMGRFAVGFEKVEGVPPRQRRVQRAVAADMLAYQRPGNGVLQRVQRLFVHVAAEEFRGRVVLLLVFEDFRRNRLRTDDEIDVGIDVFEDRFKDGLHRDGNLDAAEIVAAVEEGVDKPVAVEDAPLFEPRDGFVRPVDVGDGVAHPDQAVAEFFGTVKPQKTVGVLEMEMHLFEVVEADVFVDREQKRVEPPADVGAFRLRRRAGMAEKADDVGNGEPVVVENVGLGLVAADDAAVGRCGQLFLGMQMLFDTVRKHAVDEQSRQCRGRHEEHKIFQNGFVLSFFWMLAHSI